MRGVRRKVILQWFNPMFNSFHVFDMINDKIMLNLTYQRLMCSYLSATKGRPVSFKHNIHTHSTNTNYWGLPALLVFHCQGGGGGLSFFLLYSPPYSKNIYEGKPSYDSFYGHSTEQYQLKYVPSSLQKAANLEGLNCILFILLQRCTV